MNKLILLFLILIAACGKTNTKSSLVRQDPNAYFAAQTIRVNVYFEPGAEPYTTTTFLHNEIPVPFPNWYFFEHNIKALFSGRKSYPSLIVPKTLSEMKVLPVQNEATWTIDEVVDLNKKQALSSSKAVMNIYFLNGRAAENRNIIGFHINGGGTIAIFKEVIREAASGETLPLVAEYVEQTTLIHEVGHALGLVNNGVPMVDSHQDKEHGAHCSNPDCVMYYANEGSEGLLKLARKLAKGEDPLKLSVVFDEHCLKDTKSY